MYKVILKLDKFFLKYERREGQIDLHLQEKLPSKSPALLGLMFSVNKLVIESLLLYAEQLNILFCASVVEKKLSRSGKLY